MPHAVRAQDVASILFLGLAWGSSFLFIAVAVRSIPPLTLAAGRVLLAAAVMAAVVRATGERRPLGPRDWAMFLLIGLCGNALPFTLIGWGQARIASSLAAILIATVPLFTLAFAHAFTADDRLTPGKLAGMVLGLAGVLVLVGPGALLEMSSGVWGQLAVVGGALSFAATNLLASRLRTLPPAQVAAAVMLCAALWTVPASLAIDRPWTLSPAPVSVLALAALGLISTALASLVYFRLIARTRPTFVALSSYLMPAVGVMWGVALLGETFAPRALVAFALILAGIAAAGLARGRARPARR